MSNTFGPKKPLFGPYTYRVKQNSNGDTLIAVYHGSKRIAHMDAYWAYSMRSIEEHEAEETQRAAGGRRRRLVCASDLRALGAEGKYPNVLGVTHAYIDDDAYKGKGIGRAMYEAMMAEGYAVRETRVGGSPGPMFFIPDECKGAGNTSAEAQRVWASLVRDYPSQGTSIRVDAPPIIGSRTKPNPRRRNPEPTLGNIVYTGPHTGEPGQWDENYISFYAEAPNPRYDPEEYYVIRGEKRWWEKPTQEVGSISIGRDKDGSFWVATVGVSAEYQRKGIAKRLYDMAWEYAQAHGSGLRSGWVRSPRAAAYWESMVEAGKAETYANEWTEHNVMKKGWRRTRNPRRSNPRLGTMMEGFKELLTRPRVDRVLAEGVLPDGNPYRLTQQNGNRYRDTLDILRLKVGNRNVAAVAGEMGYRLFIEHNTYTLPEARGKGYMRLLYTLLLDRGIGVRSDQWNHSLPMRRVWMALARTGFVFVEEEEKHPGGFSTPTGRFLRVRGDDVSDPLLDHTLFAAPGATLEEAEEAMSEMVEEGFRMSM